MSRRYAIDEDNCAYRIVDGEAILIHSETTFYYGLNDAGTRIWQRLLDGDLSVDEAAAVLAGDAGPAGAELVSSAAAFLEQLAGEQLLSREGEASAPTGSTTGESAAPTAPGMPTDNKYDSLDDLIITGE